MRVPTPIDYHNANLASKDRAKVCSYRNTAILKHGGGSHNPTVKNYDTASIQHIKEGSNAACSRWSTLVVE